ncbi:MAG: abortive infection protein [Bacteroidetes bacterium]|nr:MAG: abortive infection protein [Bacteroidota bacterium]
MKLRGINYDTGTTTTTGGITRESFDLVIVEKEIKIIKEELHCNAIRISGIFIDRVTRASEMALKLGLTVCFSPFPLYDNPENTLEYIIQSAMAAEKLRARYSNVILVLGCELSLFTSGFIKGNDGNDRLANLFSPVSLLKNMIGIKRRYNKRLNKFLSKAIGEIKMRFSGQVTYASGTWEKVNWKEFDIIGVDLYRSSYNKSTYLKELRHYKSIGKPFMITEFGCCAYSGADEKGAAGWAIVDWKKDIPELKRPYTRDETVQSRYLLELLDIFEKEEVTGAFVFTFISYNYLYNEDPRYDLDMASYGIVKSMPGAGLRNYEDMQWIPKQAFYAVGNYFENHGQTVATKFRKTQD